MSRKTALFICGPAMGHVTRLYSIAQSLRALSDVDIQFATPRPAAFIDRIIGPDFIIHRIAAADRRQTGPDTKFADGLEALFSDLRPDVIVQDANPLRWIPFVRFPECPRVVVTNFFLTGSADLETVQTRTFKEKSAHINAVRASRNLPPLQSAQDLYNADVVLLADPAVLWPDLTTLPANHHFGGPCFQTTTGELPDDLQEETDLLLIALGSTGRAMPSSETIEALARWSGSRIVVRVGGKLQDGNDCPGIDHGFDWLPLHPVLQRTRLTISQGGAGSTYMALAAGVPVAVMPTHVNHRLLGDIVEQNGLGLCLGNSHVLDKFDTLNYGDVQAAAKRYALADHGGPDVIAAKILEVLP